MMTTTETSYVPAVVSPDFDSFTVRQAVAGFLAGYGDTTRQAYSLDLRQWLRWCDEHELRVFEVRRAHIELFGRSPRARRHRHVHRRPPRRGVRKGIGMTRAQLAAIAGVTLIVAYSVTMIVTSVAAFCAC